jgi:hypothetical protein
MKVLLEVMFDDPASENATRLGDVLPEIGAALIEDPTTRAGMVDQPFDCKCRWSILIDDTLPSVAARP